MNNYEQDTINELERILKICDKEFIVPCNKPEEYKTYLVEELKKYNVIFYEVSFNYEE